jgi:hypothetical protein
MPKHYLLTAAGFSANWGGWVANEVFEYLLGCPEVIQDPRLRDLLWRHQASGGFEDSLAELKLGRSPGFAQTWSEKDFTSLMNAIGRTFDAMNQGFLQRDIFEFSNDLIHHVATFLRRFDAIFTLNQDVLLEHFYMSSNMLQQRPVHIPGMNQQRNPDPLRASQGWASWTPMPAGSDRSIRSNTQPYIKLHGSSNWFDKDGSRILILGATKQREIQQSEILRWYSEIFEQCLRQPDSRLMIIGYGFRDDHINATVKAAAESGLKIFVVDPRGARVAYDMNPTRQRGQIPADTELEQWLHPALIGASRRPLGETFGGRNDTELAKVSRFFERP